MTEPPRVPTPAPSLPSVWWRALACGGMNHTVTPNLCTFQPVEMLHASIRWSPAGLSVMLSHSHVGGRFGECEVDHYTGLTFAELNDVLDAYLSELGVVRAL